MTCENAALLHILKHFQTFLAWKKSTVALSARPDSLHDIKKARRNAHFYSRNIRKHVYIRLEKKGADKRFQQSWTHKKPFGASVWNMLTEYPGILSPDIFSDTWEAELTLYRKSYLKKGFGSRKQER